jgi:hypothetical protein
MDTTKPMGIIEIVPVQQLEKWNPTLGPLALVCATYKNLKLDISVLRAATVPNKMKWWSVLESVIQDVEVVKIEEDEQDGQSGQNEQNQTGPVDSELPTNNPTLTPITPAE